MDLAFWFVSLACIGALYVATICARPLAYLALCLRRPKDLHSYGSWAIVTGPTSGLGRSMAMELARRGLNLVLLDLDAANLQETSDAIKAVHAAMDGLDVGLLVNNAAVNTPGAVYLHEADIERFVRMIRVNLWGLTEVTAAVLPRMLEQGKGAIVNVGSGSTVAVPYVATFSRSLYVEYKSKGIDVQYQVPFYVHTRMLSSAVKAKLRPWFVATADEYTRTAARWIGNGPLCVPGAAQKLQWCLTGFVPDWVHDWYRIRLHLQHRAVTRAARSGSRERGHPVPTPNDNSVGPKIRG
nr:unnamed protein product [Digitaria exilis]